MNFVAHARLHRIRGGTRVSPSLRDHVWNRNSGATLWRRWNVICELGAKTERLRRLFAPNHCQ
jgi:hypothetical protein